MCLQFATGGEATNPDHLNTGVDLVSGQVCFYVNYR